MPHKSIRAYEAVKIGPEYITEITGREPRRLTAVQPTNGGGWIVEAEMVEERRIPSSADMLALYEVELDADGELLACSRTRRYMRNQMDAGPLTANGDASGVDPE